VERFDPTPALPSRGEGVGKPPPLQRELGASDSREREDGVKTAEGTLHFGVDCDIVMVRVILFEGLEPGLYEVYAYAVRPLPRYVPVEVTVPGALTENPQLCTGPMPADWVFRRGVTHTVHRVWAVGGVIQIRVTGPDILSYLNGLQLKKLK
jgi:hypothetical protein